MMQVLLHNYDNYNIVGPSTEVLVPLFVTIDTSNDKYRMDRYRMDLSN